MSNQTTENDTVLRADVRHAQRVAAQWARDNDDAQYVCEVLADVADYMDHIAGRCPVHPEQPKACYLCL